MKNKNQNNDYERQYNESLQNKSIEELKEEAEKQKLINEIKSGVGTPNGELARKLAKMKTWSIVSIVLTFFLIGIFFDLVFSIIYGIQILTTDWKNREVNDSKTIWGILCFIFLGVISSLIFAIINEKKYI